MQYRGRGCESRKEELLAEKGARREGGKDGIKGKDGSWQNSKRNSS